MSSLEKQTNAHHEMTRGGVDDEANGDNRVSRIYLRAYRGACSGSRIWRVFYKVGSIVLNSDFGNCRKRNIGSPLRLPHPFNIIISEHAKIGDGCTIFHGVTIGSNEKEPIGKSAPTIGNGVYIGAGAILIGPIVVDDGAKVGAGAIVTKDVPSGATVVGENRIICSPSQLSGQ